MDLPSPESFAEMEEEDKLEVYESLLTLWENIPSNVAFFVKNQGAMWGFTKRNYDREVGVLLESEWELQSVTYGQVDQEYDPVTRERLEEHRTRKMDGGVILAYDLIQKQDPIEQDPQEVEAEPE